MTETSGMSAGGGEDKLGRCASSDSNSSTGSISRSVRKRSGGGGTKTSTPFPANTLGSVDVSMRRVNSPEEDLAVIVPGGGGGAAARTSKESAEEGGRSGSQGSPTTDMFLPPPETPEEDDEGGSLSSSSYGCSSSSASPSSNFSLGKVDPALHPAAAASTPTKPPPVKTNTPQSVAAAAVLSPRSKGIAAAKAIEAEALRERNAREESMAREAREAREARHAAGERRAKGAGGSTLSYLTGMSLGEPEIRKSSTKPPACWPRYYTSDFLRRRIFTCLSIGDLSRAASVSKRWLNAAEDGDLIRWCLVGGGGLPPHQRGLVWLRLINMTHPEEEEEEEDGYWGSSVDSTRDLSSEARRKLNQTQSKDGSLNYEVSMRLSKQSLGLLSVLLLQGPSLSIQQEKDALWPDLWSGEAPLTPLSPPRNISGQGQADKPWDVDRTNPVSPRSVSSGSMHSMHSTVGQGGAGAGAQAGGRGLGQRMGKLGNGTGAAARRFFGMLSTPQTIGSSGNSAGGALSPRSPGSRSPTGANSNSGFGGGLSPTHALSRAGWAEGQQQQEQQQQREQRELREPFGGLYRPPSCRFGFRDDHQNLPLEMLYSRVCNGNGGGGAGEVGEEQTRAGEEQSQAIHQLQKQQKTNRCSCRIERVPGLYSALLASIDVQDHADMTGAKSSRRTSMKDIQKDIPRTMGMVNTGPLRNVLVGLSVDMPEVGYVQGMNFVVRLLLVTFGEEREEDVFWAMKGMMHSFALRRMYCPGMPMLQLRFYQLDRLLLWHLTDLHEHLEANDIRPTIYATSWFVTLLSDGSLLPESEVIVLWDLLFLHSGQPSQQWGILFCIILEVLRRAQPLLLPLNGFDLIANQLHRLKQTTICKDGVCGLLHRGKDKFETSTSLVFQLHVLYDEWLSGKN